LDPPVEEEETRGDSMITMLRAPYDLDYATSRVTTSNSSSNKATYLQQIKLGQSVGRRPSQGHYQVGFHGVGRVYKGYGEEDIALYSRVEARSWVAGCA